MSDIKTAEQKFTDFLEKKDLKLTSQRKTILKEAFQIKGHFTAEELLDFSKKKDESISKATLYRTLSLLTESEILEEHDFNDGRKTYERHHGKHHHDHMVCVNCKTIIEFESDEIEAMQEKEAKKRHFKIVFHSHKLFGLCQNCQNKKQ